MRKRTAIALILTSVFAVNVGTATVEASWLSKTLKKLDNALGVPDSNTQVTQQSDGKLRGCLKQEIVGFLFLRINTIKHI